MKNALIADTHSAIWFLSKDKKLSQTARQAMRKATASGDPIYISAITLVEMAYLIEKNRLDEMHIKNLLREINSPSSNYELVSIDLAITQTLRKIPRDDVPDMPDRIIAATALHLGLPLVTRDSKIRSANLTTVW